jgi:ABC-type branched-subunit amino acid transport system substrate-binding protein
MKRYRILAVLLALGLVAAACGRDDDTATGGDSNTTTTAAAGGDEACEGVELEATEIGVTEDTITIQVMADINSPLAPGLFKGNADALEGFAEFINANGGIACRDLEVEVWDSKLTPEEAKNGQIQACTNSLALVGGNSLFNPDVTTMETCADKAGAATGIPDVAALANDVNQQCAEVTFIIQGISETCPIAQGVRPLTAFIGNIEFYQEQVAPDPLKGIFLVPGDLPTTVQSATYQIVAQEDAGVDIVEAIKVSGRDAQSAFTPKVQLAREAGANYVYNGSNDVAMTNMRREAAAQGLTGVDIWACSLACYTQKFQEAAADVQDTYVWMQFLPFEDAGSNEELDNYLSSVDVPDSFGAQAWMAAVLFQDAVNDVVETDGPNGLTRAALLEALNGITEFDANGWMGPKNPKGGFSDCLVIMQMKADGFERVFPEEPGTIECSPDALVEVSLDPAAEAANIN